MEAVVDKSIAALLETLPQDNKLFITTLGRTRKTENEKKVAHTSQPTNGAASVAANHPGGGALAAFTEGREEVLPWCRLTLRSRPSLNPTADILSIQYLQDFTQFGHNCSGLPQTSLQSIRSQSYRLLQFLWQLIPSIPQQVEQM